MEFQPLPDGPVEIMIDLETLGTDPYSPVIAIGAVRFVAGPMTGGFEPFYQAIDVESTFNAGLRPSASTLKWWMQQSKEAQQVFHDPAAVKLEQALDAFTDWLGSRPDRLWGNSAAFDLGLLAACYRATNKQVPWTPWVENCYRTLKGLPGMGKFKLQRRGTHHNALDDAISQAHHCRQMLMYLAKLQASPAPEPLGKPLGAGIEGTAPNFE